MNPEAYETVTKRLEELSKRNEGIVKKIEAELRDLLVASGLTSAYVKGRQKKPYSVFRKMQSKSLSFEQLSDVYGFRLIVEDIPSCYRALGIVHTRWRVVPGRFKDYISTPKQNDYRSLHTTIVGPSMQRIELQIRTKRMHDPRFKVTVEVTGVAPETGVERSKRAAEQVAATKMLEREGIWQSTSAGN